MPSAADTDGVRILTAVLVYNGRDFVGRCLESAAAVDPGRHTFDTLVLDDCSPEPGFSAELRERCHDLGLGYYRSPRNLGIPRNMNLGLLKAMADDYDYVLLANSDVVFPQNLATGLVDAAVTDPSVGSVTAWSNNVSIFSIPNDGTTPHLSAPQNVDWMSRTLERLYGGTTAEIPVGVGFCLFIPTPVVRDVGLMDPVFGRGWCEEVDWCLRSHERGYHSVLAPGVFVFHEGSATAREVGLFKPGVTTNWEHEAIVDMRHPTYRNELESFAARGGLTELQAQAARHVVVEGAGAHGYHVRASWIRTSHGDTSVATFHAKPDGQFALEGRFMGFYADFTLDSNRSVLDQLHEIVGRAPDQVGIFDRGRHADRLLAAARQSNTKVTDMRSYPERV